MDSVTSVFGTKHGFKIAAINRFEKLRGKQRQIHGGIFADRDRPADGHQGKIILLNPLRLA